MKILFNSPNYPSKFDPSSFIFVKEQVKALKYSNKFSAIIVASVIPITLKKLWLTRTNPFGYKVMNDGAIEEHIITFPAFPFFIKLNLFIRDFILYRLNSRLVKNRGIDLIHVHNASVAHAAFKVKREFGTPFMITEHSTAYSRGIINEKNLRLYELFYHESSVNLAVSKQFVDLLSNLYKSISFEFLPNVVDTEKFNLKDKTLNTYFQFVNVAYLDRKKNQIDLLKAFNILRNELDVDVRLVIVGDGPMRNELEKCISELKLKNSVKLLGKIDHEFIPYYFRSSDAFVLTSSIETFGVVLIEAMSCGIPVISTRSGGPETIITNNEIGRLVNVGDIKGIADAMKEVINYGFDSKVIRQNVIDFYSYKSISNSLHEKYLKVLNIP